MWRSCRASWCSRSTCPGSSPETSGGERRRCEDGEGECVSVERRVEKFMRKFQLPEDADLDAITALCQDGVLTVTVEKPPPPEPKKPKTIDVKMG
ncbi:unnamed protein product [Musa textilis]